MSNQNPSPYSNPQTPSLYLEDFASASYSVNGTSGGGDRFHSPSPDYFSSEPALSSLNVSSSSSFQEAGTPDDGSRVLEELGLLVTIEPLHSRARSDKGGNLMVQPKWGQNQPSQAGNIPYTSSYDQLNNMQRNTSRTNLAREGFTSSPKSYQNPDLDENITEQTQLLQQSSSWTNNRDQDSYNVANSLEQQGYRSDTGYSPGQGQDGAIYQDSTDFNNPNANLGNQPYQSSSNLSTQQISSTNGKRHAFAPSPNHNLYHKWKYFSAINRLVREAEPRRQTLDSSGKPFERSLLIEPPQHVLPHQLLFWALPPIEPGQFRSRRTIILSIANTMIGSTIWSTPWAFSQSGFFGGILTLILIGAISCYTCYLYYKNSQGKIDITDMVEPMGPLAKWTSLIASNGILVVAIIVYFVLLNDAIFSVGHAICDKLGAPVSNNYRDSSTWNPGYSSFIVLGMLYPLSSLKKLDPLLKAGSFAVLSVAYAICFVIYCSIVNLHTPIPSPHSNIHEHHHTDVVYIIGHPFILPTFVHLAGMATLGFFLHSVVMSCAEGHPEPEKFHIDLAISYSIVCFCYALLGSIAYLGFNGELSNFQNFLNYFSPDYLPAVIARIGLILQLFTVTPLLIYILRIQIFGRFKGAHWPGYKWILPFNLVWLGISALFAVFFPKIGTIMRFAGALFGFMLMFSLPLWLDYHLAPFPLKSLKAGYSIFIVIVGACVLISQIFIS